MVKTRSNVENKDSPASPSENEAALSPTDMEAAGTSLITAGSGAAATLTTPLTAPTADLDVTLRHQSTLSRRGSSKASSKKRLQELLKIKEEIAKRREELAQRQLETTEARLATLQCLGTDSEDDDEVHSVVSNQQRTESWVRRQAQVHDDHPAGDTPIVPLTAPAQHHFNPPPPPSTAIRPTQAGAQPVAEPTSRDAYTEEPARVPLPAAAGPTRAHEPPPSTQRTAPADSRGAPPRIGAPPPPTAYPVVDNYGSSLPAYVPPPSIQWTAPADSRGAPPHIGAPAPPTAYPVVDNYGSSLPAYVPPSSIQWTAPADSRGPPPRIGAPPPPTAYPAADDYGSTRPSYVPLPPTQRVQASPEGAHGYRDLVTALTEVAARSTAPSWRPAAELPAFSGSSTEWLVFKTAYNESARYFSEQENLARLRRCLKGPAREAVQCLFVSSTSTVEVLEILASRFGRPVAICMAEEEKLRNLPRLVDCPRDICVYATKVKNSVATIQALGKQSFLYNATLVHQITEGFPSAIRHQFYGFSCSQPSDTPELVLLGNFMSYLADRMSQFAPAEVIPLGDRREPVTAVRQHKRIAPLVRTHHVSEVSTPPSAQAQSTGKCPICGAEHHRAKDCATLTNSEPAERWVLIKKYRLCFRCLKTRKFKHSCKTTKCSVNDCKYTHHPLLHDPNYRPNVETTAHIASADADAEEEQTDVIIAAVKAKARNAYLQVLPVCVSGPNGEYDTYALLDLGSTSTLIETSVAEAVGARGWSDPFCGELVCGSNFDASASKRVEVSIRGRDSDRLYDIRARTVNKLGLSSQAVPADLVRSYPHLSDLTDKLLLDDARPTVLVGVNHHSLADARQLREGKERDQLAAVLTDLGWALYGARSAPRRPQHMYHLRERICHVWEQPSEEEEVSSQVRRLKNEVAMHDLMREHFSLECLGVAKKRPYTDGEQRALDLLDKYTCQLPAGGYVTCLPWRNDDQSPPDNRFTAIRRLELVEKKLERLPEMKRRYHEQMKSLLDNGYAERAPEEVQPAKCWYLPHFGVVHPEKPGKLRIVHDAAAVTKGVSLNSLLLPGPDLLQSLPGVLMRFREHPVAVTADIKDMFLRVTIREEDRDMQRFLWRDDPRGGPPLEYRMKSVIFGATSSPCTAIFVKNLNAKRFEVQYPEAARAIVKNHYVDDYLVSFKDEEEAIRISRQVDEIHRQANFYLSKWSSNSPRVVEELSPSGATTSCKLELDPTKVLGMVWDPRTDTLSFNLNEKRIDGAILQGERTPTKREALRAAMSVYDPLGLVTPITIQSKRILQDVWRSEIEWDAPLQPKEADAWRNWGRQVMWLPKLTLPRCYDNFTKGKVRELHTFVDASSTAYAAVVYWRVTDERGIVHTSLVSGKARVAPIGKVHTIPRLELQAAVPGCRLAQTAQRQHDLAPTECFYWSDSKTVLTWLRNGAREYKPFVAHRIAEIHDTTRTSDWRWVPTKDNVADDATRATPDNFGPEHRWFKGPIFLNGHPNSWPKEDSSMSLTTPDPEAVEEEKTYAMQEQERLSDALPKVERFSDWRRLIRTTARVLMFITKLKRERISAHQDKDVDWVKGQRKGKSSKTGAKPKLANTNIVQKATSLIPAVFLIQAEALWVRAIQLEAFKDDLRRIKEGERLPAASRLFKVATKIDDAGTLRLRSRVALAEDITPDQREPAILPGEHTWVSLYVAHVHRQMHHGGREITANEVRQRYWVLQLRKVVKTQVSKCVFCRIRKAMPSNPSTGNHPGTRLAHHRPPFTFTAVDYFGPMAVTVGRSRQKRYGALFTCLTTRAVHLELAGTLSTSSAIMALRRFIARRGCPTEIHSDNGTNFRGADKELRQAAQSATEQEASSKAIRWRFIPPGAPFMGGAWERMVRTVKTALNVVLQEKAPNEEVLATLITEVEHTVNSRPLTNVTSDPDDPEALTPNHFLLGGPSRVPQPGLFTKDDEIGYTKVHWRQAQRLADMFWARWVREYLPELQHRREPHSKGEPIKLGNLVLIADGNLPRNQWPRGVVAAVYPGTDGEIRVVDIRLAGGRVLRRPTKKLVVLPVGSTPA